MHLGPARVEDLDEIEVRSAGTGRWHVGQPMDPRAAYALAVHGFDGTAHRAQTLSPGLLRWADTVLAASEVADGLYEAYVSPR